LIKEGIDNPDKFKDQPSSDLTVDKLNTIFGTTGLSAADINESS